MKLIWLLFAFALCPNLNANVAAFGQPVIDTRAPGYFARLVGRSDFAVIPVYDAKHRSMRQPVVVHERAQLDQLAQIFAHAVYRPSSHLLAVLAGGPITFYAADKQRVLTFEPFGEVVRLNNEDYKIDGQSATALAAWLKKVQDDQHSEPTGEK